MKVSVIIVNWNGRPHLNETLIALKKQSLKPERVIIVDNGSTDGSDQDIRELEWNNLVKIFLTTNTGFAAGNNAALPHLTGDAVALLNNDAVPDRNWLKEASKALHSEGDVGMVACKIVRFESPKIIDKCGHLIYADGLNRGWGTGEPDQTQYQKFQEVLWPDGCAALFKLSAIKEVGFFDEDFFCYGEDADLGFRMRWAGYRCLFQPTSLVFHRHSSSLGKFSPYKAYLIERNRWWVLLQNFPLKMILSSPFATLVRYGFNLISLGNGKGSAAGFKSEQGACPLIKVLLKANWHGLMGSRRAWRKRRKILKRISEKEMMALLKQFSISVKNLTLRD